MFRRLSVVVVVLATIVFVPAFVFGQPGASGVAGVVRDSSGATIPGATEPHPSPRHPSAAQYWMPGIA